MQGTRWRRAAIAAIATEASRRARRRRSLPLTWAAAVTAAVLATLATAVVGAPARWVKVIASPDGLVTFYVDRAGIRGHPPRTVRILYDYREVQQDPDTLREHLSSIVEARIDCRGRRIGTARSADFSGAMGQGRREPHIAGGAPEMRDVAEGSIDARILDTACAGR